MNLVYPGERTRFAIAATLAILFWAVLIIGTIGIALLWLLMFFIVYLFAHSAFISYLRGSAVKLSPEQFPELHARVEAASHKLGLKVCPDAYLLHADGFFNALATRFLGRNYIVLFSSVLDALEDHPGAVDFYIGHEIGHIHRGHLVWGPVLAPATILPLLGAGLSRAEEYTCDRYGLAACESAEDARIGLAALVAGHTRWKTLNLAAFAAQKRDSSGFWMSYHELTGSYPWLSKRVAAVEALAQGQEPKPPVRNPFAYLFALFTPHISGGGGGAGLLLLVAIIGILAAIAIPAYQDYTNRALTSQAYGLSAGPRMAIAEYAAEKGEWPGSLADVGIEESSFPLGQGSGSLVLGEEGTLLVVLESAPFNGGALTFTPQVEEGAVSGWDCSSEDLATKYLPTACR